IAPGSSRFRRSLMANYYSTTVIQPTITEADMTSLERLLLGNIFSAESPHQDGQSTPPLEYQGLKPRSRRDLTFDKLNGYVLWGALPEDKDKVLRRKSCSGFTKNLFIIMARTTANVVQTKTRNARGAALY